MSDFSPSVYNDLSSLSRLKAQSAEKPQEALQEAARQFEALFMSMMIKAMRDTVPEDSMFGSSSMKNYQEMFDQQLALDLSRKSGMGLSDLIARQLATGMQVADAETAEATDAVGSIAGTAALDAYTVQEQAAPDFGLKR